MIKYYNFLSSASRAVYKSGVGDGVGSPPTSNSKTTSKSWLVLVLMFLSMTIGQKISAQTYFTESFEGTYFLNGNPLNAATAAGPNAPSGWTQTRVLNNVAPATACSTSGGKDWGQMSWSGTAYTSVLNAGLGASGCSPFGGAPTAPPDGSKVMWFYDGWCSTGNTRRIESPNINLSTSTSPTISFSYSYAQNSTSLSLVGSLDGGVTWNTLSTLPSTTSGVWVARTVAIPSSYQVATAKFGFQIVSTFGSFDAFVDNVVVAEGTAPDAAPITFSATAITPSGMTVGWVDNSTNETGFRVYRSVDNINFSQIGADITSTSVATTGTAYTSVQTGLVPGTTYYYKIASYIVGEKTLSGGSATTNPGATYYWVGASGAAWGTAANWNTNPAGGGATRATALTTDVLIIDGAGTTPGGSLTISVDTASFSIGQFQVTSNTTCLLVSSAATTRTITITGGSGADFVIAAGSTLSLTSATNAVAFAFSGTGNTGDISGTYNASGSTSNNINTTGGTGTLVTVSATGVVNNNIVGSSGCMTGSAATLSFADGSNYTHGSFTTSNGYIPLATWATNSTVTITGGTASTGITNPAQSFGNFVYNSATSTATMSVWTTGTTAVVKGNLTITQTGTGAAMFRAVTSGTVTVNGNLNINGGRFQVGNGTASTNGVIVLGTTTVAAAGILDINSAVFSQRGALLTNDGTLTGTAAASTLQFLNFTGSFAQTLAGTGTVLTNVGTMSVQNTAGLTISHTNQVVLGRVNLFQGTVTNSNKITFGTGAINCTTQIGAAGLTTPGGSFDAIPTFNLGTGTYNVIYAQESVARTTGNEIPSTRTISAMTASNSNGITVSGGTLSTGTLTFAAGTGNITTSSANVLTVTGTTTGSIVRTSTTAFVNGPLAITLPASLAAGTTYLLPVGKSALNPFALVDATTNAGGTVTVQAEVFDADAAGTPGVNISSLSTTRYWAASITGGGANFTDALIQLNDTTTGRDAIAGSATVNGAYDLQGGVAITTTPTSLTTTAPKNTTLPGFFLMANKAAASVANLTITPSGTQCANVARTVTAEVTPGGGAVSGVVINYSVNGVAQTAVAMTNTTGNGGLSMDVWSGTIPTVTPTNALVTWSVTATDVNSLTKTLAGTSYSDDPLFAFPATASASVANICGSGSSVLTASLSSSVNATIGTATTLTSATTQPTAFCNRWPSYRMQTVYTAAELQAAGLSAGNITSMAFNISTLGDAATNSGFTVKIGTTTLSTLSGAFQSTTGYTTVYPSQTYTHTASGLQTIPFSTPYAWDGVSNIIVEVIHNGADALNNSQTYYTATAGNTVAYTAFSATDAASFSNQRLNVVFAGTASAPISSVLWSNGDTGVTTTVNPTSTTTYTATITSGGCTKVTTPVTVNVLPVPTAPAVGVTTPTCGPGVPLVSVTDPNGFTTPTFKWYADNTTTTALQSSTSATYTSSISVSTDFYVSVVNPTTGCESTRTLVSAVVNTPDPITGLSNQSICIGGSFTLTAASVNTGYTYTWSAAPSAGSGIGTPLTGATQTITPTIAGTYIITVAATDGNCNTSATFTVTVNPFPVIASVTATPAAVCNDGISTLTAVAVPPGFTFATSTGAALDPMTGATSVITTGNDDTPTAAPASIGFTFAFNGVNYTQYSVSPDGWILLGGATASSQFTNQVTSTTNTPKLYPYWDDLATGADGNVKTLVTGTAPNRIFIVEWNVTIPRALTGSANSKFQAWLYETTGVVEYRYGAMGAQTSNNISAGYTVNATNFSSITFSSNTTSTTTANDANNSVPASGRMYSFTPNAPSVFTWAPTTDLYTDAAATTAYTGGPASVVYSKPTATISYTATLTSPAGCVTTSAPVSVTQNGLTIAPITDGFTSACLGSSTVIDFENATVGVTWTSSNPAVATIDANGTVTVLSQGSTIIGANIFDSGTGCTSYAPNTVTLDVYTPVTVTTQPIPASVLPSTTATFSIAATGSIVGYQWQVSANNSTWSNLSNDSTYSGVTTNTLTINATTAENGLFYRCSVSGNSPCTSPVNSNSAQLSVQDLAITSNPASVELCTNGTGSASFTVAFSSAPDEIIWEYFDLTDWVVIDGTETTLGSVTYTGETTTTLTLNGLSLVNNGWKVRVNGVLNSPSATVTSSEATITINDPAVITSQPANQSACYSGATSTFSVVATGGTGYQWQYATSSTGPWSNVADNTPTGATYTGATSATLNVATTSATPAAGTYFYQVVVGSPIGCANAVSTAAQLQIKTPVITASNSGGTICSPGGSPVTLTASGAGVGGTYAWSPAAGLSATTGNTVTANPTATTVYTVTGTDSTGCSNTATVTVTVAPALTPTATATPATVCNGTNSQLLAASGLNDEGAPSSYCTPTVGNPGATSDFINNFVFAGISNLASGDDPADYSDFTSLTANVVGGSSYPISITPGSTTFSQGFRVFIDYNQNGVFEASESAYASTAASTATASGTVTIPVTAYNGTTRLRVVDRFSAVPTTAEACGHTGWGEYEDYSVSITGATNPPVYTYSWSPSTFLSATNVKNPIATGVTATTTYTVNVTSSTGCTASQTVTVTVASGIGITTQPASTAVCQGASTTLSVVATGSGLTYQWRKNGVDIPGEIFTSYSIPVTALTDAGNYDVVINSACGDPAVTSSVAVLTVNPTPTATSPGAQSFCAGATTPIALTGTPGGVTFNISGGTAIGLADQTGVTSIPSFTAIAGTATISVTPTANGCTGSPVTFVMTINATPGTPTVVSNTPVNCGSDLNLTASTVNVSGYTMNSNSGVAFIDISGTGTSVGTLADDSEHNITIPSFVYNGVAYTTARVGNNGAIVFGSTTGDITFSNVALPTSTMAAGSAFLAPYWDDLDIQTGAVVTTQTVGNLHIIQYTTMAHNAFTTGSITFQVQLNLTTGQINYVYSDVIFGDSLYDSGVNATVGIQMSNTSAVQYSLNTASLVNGQSITFTPNVASYSWTGPNGFTSTAQNPTITAVTAAAAGDYTLVVTNPVTGCSSAPVTHTVSVVNCESIVNLKLFIEGYYDVSTGEMRPVKNNQDFVSPMTDVADITVELYDSTTNALVASTTSVLKTDGTATCTFSTAPSGSFYLTVKGNNFIQTWAASPVSVGSTPLTYDFSDAANKAFGDNMALVDTGVYGFFSGDVNSDGSVDNTDYSLWETDANNFAFGVYPTDLNGDGSVDNTDYSIWENNANNFVFSFSPF